MLKIDVSTPLLVVITKNIGAYLYDFPDIKLELDSNFVPHFADKSLDGVMQLIHRNGEVYFVPKKDLEPVVTDKVQKCPICGGTKLLLRQQCIVYKLMDVNRSKYVSLIDVEKKLTQREKAMLYDSACTEDIGLQNYECVSCGWTSESE